MFHTAGIRNLLVVLCTIVHMSVSIGIVYIVVGENMEQIVQYIL